MGLLYLKIMKNLVKMNLTLSMVIVTFVAFISCENNDQKDSPVAYTSILDVAPDGTTSILQEELKSVLYDEPVLEQTDEEILMHMLEEEKLARDVYAALYNKWGVPVFSKIANAEQKHLDAILWLAQNYSTLDVEAGEPRLFENPDFTALYEKLVAQGSESIIEAYKVGALIEELDIYDLTSYVTQTANENILLVFENLMKGSRNHLRAFNIQLVALGVVYKPQYLDQVTFDEIVS